MDPVHVPFTTPGAAVGAKGGHMPERDQHGQQSNIGVEGDHGRGEAEAPDKQVDQEAGIFVMDGLAGIATVSALLGMHKRPPLITDSAGSKTRSRGTVAILSIVVRYWLGRVGPSKVFLGRDTQ